MTSLSIDAADAPDPGAAGASTRHVLDDPTVAGID